MVADLLWPMLVRWQGARCDRRRRVQVCVLVEGVSPVAADLRWFMRLRVMVNGRPLGVPYDLRHRARDFVSAGGASLQVAGLGYPRRLHLVVAATKVSLLAVGVKLSMARMLGLREKWTRKNFSQMMWTRQGVGRCC